jgi:hypothetical protein
MSAGYIIYSLDWDKFRQLVDRPTPEQLAALANLISDGLDEHDGEFDEGDPVQDWPSDLESLAKIAAQRLAMPDWYGDLSTTGKNLWEGVIFSACMNCDEIDVGFRVDSDGVYWDVIEIAWKHLGVVPSTISDVALSAFGKRPYRYRPPVRSDQTRDQFDRDEDARKASLRTLSDTLGQLLEGVKQGRQDVSPDALLEKLQQHEGISQQHLSALKGLLSDDDSDEESLDEGLSDDWSPMHSMHTPDEVEKILAELQSVDQAMRSTNDTDARTDYTDELMPALERVAHDRRMLFIQVDT